MDKDHIIVITSGFFNPIHRGHIGHLELAKNLFPKVHHIVIVNNDQQVLLKKGYDFVPLVDRVAVVSALRCVDEVFSSIDEDISVCRSFEALAKKYSGYKVVFAKGGDRNANNIPEKVVCDQYNIEIISGVGGNPTSSTEIINKIRKD